MVDYAVISNNNILNYWLSLCHFKVSAFRPLTRPRRRVRHCLTAIISNAMIQFVPSCQDKRTRFVNVLDPPFSDIACSILTLSRGIFMPKNSSNKVLPFGDRGSRNYASPCRCGRGFILDGDLFLIKNLQSCLSLHLLLILDWSL